MTINIEEEVEVSFPFDYKKLAEKVILAALDAEDFPFEAEIGLLLVSLKGIQEINCQQRNLDKPTDVLSFPMTAYEKPGDFANIERDEDIVLCVDKVKEQAESFGHSEMREFSFLILHSMLHLFGYDHMTKEEAEEMEKKQREILDQMGISR